MRAVKHTWRGRTMKIQLYRGTMASMTMFFATLKWLKSNRNLHSEAKGFSGPAYMDVCTERNGEYTLNGKLDNQIVFWCECFIGESNRQIIPARVSLQLFEKGDKIGVSPLLLIECDEFALVELTTGDKELTLFNVRSTARS